MDIARKNRISRILQVSSVLLWLLYTVAVLFDFAILYNILSPLTALSCVLLIHNNLPLIGRYKPIASFFMLGTFVWFIADILLFINIYFFPESEELYMVQDNLYLVPDYFFAMGLVAYVVFEFTKTHSQRILVSTFILTAIGFMVGMKFIETKRGNSFDPETLSTMLYFFIVLFTLIIMVLIFTTSRLRGHTPSAYASAIALSVYNLLEIRYTYMMSTGEDPESIYIDIIYLFTIVVYALSYSHKSIIERQKTVEHAEFIFRSHPYAVWANSFILIVTSIILYLVHFFDLDDVYMMILSILGYIIMCKNIQTSELTEKLLEHERDENLRLEKLVNEKTAELIQINEHLKMISNTDALTGLSNRRYGFDYLNRLVDSKDTQPFAVYSLDLNRFKPINDNFGHDAGDRVLMEVGARLSSIPQKNCLAFRMGGDEFMVVLSGIKDMSLVESVAEIICRSIDRPIVCGKDTFDISTSIGISVFPDDADNIIHLVKYADEAMYAVKHTGEKSVYKLHSKNGN